MLRYLSAGESHGPCLTAIIEGVPSNLEITSEYINQQLERRQQGYGRGGRMSIEKDQVKILSGVRNGKTMGGPVTLQIENKDWSNWEGIMSAAPGAEVESKQVTKPRPGHADLTGALKYQQEDMRNILERASARETAIRVAVGTFTRKLLETLGIEIAGHVVNIGGVSLTNTEYNFEDIKNLAQNWNLGCVDPQTAAEMQAIIAKAQAEGDSLGGSFEVWVKNVPPGVGSYVQWDRKLDASLAQALMSLQAIKGVEIGIGIEVANRPGSKVHDEIFYDAGKGFYRQSNNAGGIEGGMSNGSMIVLRAAMKPIPTLYKPLRSVDLFSKQPYSASVERSDVCAVPAACVVGEAIVAYTIAQFICEKFAGDSMAELRRNFEGYCQSIRQV